MTKLFSRIVLFTILIGAAVNVHAQNIYTFAGVSGPGGYSGDGSHAVLARLNTPAGIAVNSAGVVYICDFRNAVVRKVDASGIITTVAGSGTAGYSGDGGAATAAQINPAAIAVDNSGNLYISEGRNATVRKVDASGTITTIAGTNTPGFSGDGGAATAAELNGPLGVAVDTAGKVYICDGRNYVIRMINTSGIITTVAGTAGTAGYSGDGGAATAATINRPAGIAVKADGTLYISDLTGNNIRMVNTSGTISTFAGSATAGYAGDGGAATAALLNAPEGVSLDASGNLYIADAGNNVVRKVSTSGTITTVAGNGTAGFSGDGSAAIYAQLNGDSWVTVDASGNIYISDTRNNVVRKVGSAVTSITIVSDRHDTVCASVTNHFTATAYADATPHYKWVINGTTVGGDSSVLNTTIATRGSRIACFLLDTAGGSNIAVSNILVSDTAPVVGTLVGITTICIGSVSGFRDSVAGGGGAAGGGGTWSLTDTIRANIAPGGPGRVAGLVAGNDTLIYTITNTCGVATASKALTIVPNPVGPITGPASVCAGNTVTFSDTSVGGRWAIRPGRGGIIDSLGNFTAGNRPRTVYIIYGTNPACTVLDSIVVDSLPIVPPIAGPTTVNALFIITLTDPATGGTWSSSNTSIATVNPTTGDVYGVALGTATISYSITNSFGCTGVGTYDITVIDASGVKAIANTQQFSVSPNPATGSVTISWNNFLPGNGNVVITDVTGRVVYENAVNFSTTKGASTIDISSLNKGVYLINIKSANGSNVCQKLIKE